MATKKNTTAKKERVTVVKRYSAEAVKSVRATKATKGTIGAKLQGVEYSDGTKLIKATVKGVTVGIVAAADGKCTYMASKSFALYDAESAKLNEKIYLAIVEYLDAKYSLRDKTMAKLWNICEKGRNLMTKAEVKAESAAAVSAKPKAVKVAAAAVKG